MPHQIKKDTIIEAETNLADILNRENNLSVALLPTHINGLKMLANIFLKAAKSLRVDNNKPLRLDDSIPPRVEAQHQTSITNSTDTTTPEYIKLLHRTHNKSTRANKPIIITPEPECEKENKQQKNSAPRCSPRQRVIIKTPKAPIFVLQTAINETLRYAVETNSPIYVPDKIQ